MSRSCFDPSLSFRANIWEFNVVTVFEKFHLELIIRLTVIDQIA